MEAKKEDIKIYGKLVNVTTENVVADAQQIWDSNFEENQQNINKNADRVLACRHQHTVFTMTVFLLADDMNIHLIVRSVQDTMQAQLYEKTADHCDQKLCSENL